MIPRTTMTQRKRRQFTDEQKTQAVNLAAELGNISEAARQLDVCESSINRWIRQADIDEGNGKNGELTTDEKEELRRLRREVKALKNERDFLKKASAYFAQSPEKPTP